MNILIYIPNISQDWGGVRQYSIGLLKVLEKDTINSYFVYHNNEDPEIISILKSSNQFQLVQDKQFNKEFFNADFFKRIINFFFRKFNSKWQLSFSNHLQKICKKYSIDVLHCPYQRLPQIPNVKNITTLHDIQEIHFPEFFSPEERAFRANCYLDILKRANKIIVSYKHVKEDLITYFQVQPQKIDVVLLEMGKLWFEKFTKVDLLPDLNIPERFLLYPANTWKHKNHVRLLRAIALLRDSYNIKVFLICSGHLNDHFYNEVEKELVNLKLEGQVRFIGVVDERKLFSLYKNAVGVVIPTLYEAGSFPLIESILMNIPVICSNVTSLPDTIQNDDYLFNPYEIFEIACKIKMLWESEVFRQNSVENSKRVSKLLKNTGALVGIQNTYESLKDA